LSQAELARRAGTGQAAIARLELGEPNPRLNTLERIGQALGVGLVVDFVDTAAAASSSSTRPEETISSPGTRTG
jgi:transcriptional regulator with XRE-family HTH domain